MNPTAPLVPKIVLLCLSLRFHMEAASKTPNWPGPRCAGHLAPVPDPLAGLGDKPHQVSAV